MPRTEADFYHRNAPPESYRFFFVFNSRMQKLSVAVSGDNESVLWNFEICCQLWELDQQTLKSDGRRLCVYLFGVQLLLEYDKEGWLYAPRYSNLCSYCCFHFIVLNTLSDGAGIVRYGAHLVLGPVRINCSANQYLNTGPFLIAPEGREIHTYTCNHVKILCVSNTLPKNAWQRNKISHN
jgi:hypothetical protein